MILNKDIEKIKERNARVEADKAWELSKTRRILIASSIYFFALALFSMITTPKPILDALVPTLAYLLSTLTFPFFKDWWLKNVYKQ